MSIDLHDQCAGNIDDPAAQPRWLKVVCIAGLAVGTLAILAGLCR